MQEQEKQQQQQRVPAAADDPHEMARRRWRMLARALHKNKEENLDVISVRRISSFGLLSLLPLKSVAEDDRGAAWYEYKAAIGVESFEVFVRHLIQDMTPVDLMGFNNTGNICVWPSEEVLAYYALCNREFFDNKSVLELGGGMTCLAGLLIAKFTRASFVCLTDGNISSVENVSSIMKRNNMQESQRVECSVLQWGQKRPPNTPAFDVVLAADCLFFDDGRKDLVATMWSALKDDGHALVTAPRRGTTLEKFTSEAERTGFLCTTLQYYNQQVWESHLKLKAESSSYNEDIHYPLLIHLIKKTPRIE